MRGSDTLSPYDNADAGKTKLQDEEDGETQAQMLYHNPKYLDRYDALSVYSAYASSTIYQERTDNNVMLLFDGDDMTTWQEGVYGYGVGEYIDVSFYDRCKITYIGFKLGNWRNDTWYEKNARPRTMTLQLEGEDFELDFQNAHKVQWVKLENPPEIEDLRLIIDDYYMGTVYEDTCITDIYFYGEYV